MPTGKYKARYRDILDSQSKKIRELLSVLNHSKLEYLRRRTGHTLGNMVDCNTCGTVQLTEKESAFMMHSRMFYCPLCSSDATLNPHSDYWRQLDEEAKPKGRSKSVTGRSSQVWHEDLENQRTIPAIDKCAK